MAKLKKFSNVIPTTPAGKGNLFSYEHIQTFITIVSLVNMNLCAVSVYLEEEENTDAADATVVPDSVEEKLSKSDKTKKTVPGKADSLKEKTQANGTAAKKTANIKSKGKKDSPAGPKKAKIAKMDGETVKGAKVKKPAVKTADETKASKADSKEGSRFEKKQGKKTKSPMKAKNRIGKNKFKKLKRMLEKQVE